MKSNRRSAIFSVAGLPFISGILAILPQWALAKIPKSTRWAYDGTRENLSDPIERFFGFAKGKYVYLRHVPMNSIHGGNRMSVAAQFNNIFRDAAWGEYSIPGGYRVICSFRTHDATQKSFVVTLGDSNTIVATALLHNLSGRFNELVDGAKDPGNPTQADQVLTIFYSGKVAPIQAVTNGLIKIVGRQIRICTASGRVVIFRPEIRRIRGFQ